MRIRLGLMSYKAPSPVPSPCRGRRPRRPGGCRPQVRQERENVTGVRCGKDRSGGYANGIYRLLAVRFSLFRHPPRGGSADATFPRWGKEGANQQRPCRGEGGLIVKSEKLWDRLRRSFENLSRSDTTIFHYSFLSLQLKMFRLGGADASGLSVRPKRPRPFPPRVGAGVLDGPEGAAHKGGRRGRT